MCMFSKNNLLAICLSVVTLHVQGCVYPSRQMQIKVRNDSKDLVYVLYPHDKSISTTISDLLPKEETSSPILREQSDGLVAFFTSAGSFQAILSYFGNCVVLSKVEAVEKDGEWERKYTRLQRLPIVSAALAKIGPTGKVVMIPEVTAPQDGRPDVDLTIYQDVAGFTDYLSPAQIFNITPTETNRVFINERYQLLMRDWHPSLHMTAEQPYAQSARDLINWAYTKLINK